MAGNLTPWGYVTRLLGRRGAFLVPVLVIVVLTVVVLAMVAVRNVRQMFDYSPF